jgi:class 3 adenylate cyclase
VAGIVGNKKWQYDIWGDTVNIASRMESNSLPGHINLSETTFHRIKEEFGCKYRGEISVKNRGALKMYFLS